MCEEFGEFKYLLTFATSKTKTTSRMQPHNGKLLKRKVDFQI
jgi:hypothetical protein